MIILDTNVVSEMMKPEPNPAVRSWLDRQIADSIFLSSITVSELMFGVGALPDGRRKRQLSTVVGKLLALFADRILPFDDRAARAHASLAIESRGAGRGLPVPDGYIAGIAVSRGYAVATRDASVFQGADLVVIDPWNAV